MYTTVGK